MASVAIYGDQSLADSSSHNLAVAEPTSLRTGKVNSFFFAVVRATRMSRVHSSSIRGYLGAIR
jgi:hypothetical protein